MDFVGDGVYKVTLQVKNEVMGQAKKVTFPQAISGVMSPNWSMNYYVSVLYYSNNIQLGINQFK